MIPHTLFGLSFVERFYSYPELESTNAIAKVIKKKPAKNFFVIQADRQSSDRGHGDQSILSDNNNLLWVSIVTTVDTKSTALFYNRALAMAIHTSLSSLAPGKTISIKWPNHIYCNDRKIGEIDPENHSVFLDVIVLGFWLNVNADPDEFPEILQETETSLFLETGVRQSLSILLRSILSLYHQNTLTEHNEVNRYYSDILYKKGSLVEIAGKNGIFEGVDSDGRFCLLKDGKRIVLSAGSPVF
jgi:BirA family biotin operon repressor/biotin-[acetyl-CoA-carboxylase] ligase